ncbi:MaoC/PaaZ C-terminal domain-containing protein [Phytoactinopolyspora limicola]|uniref:MaoC/PaaZ C-terminal domain-containing protein n=1 Tax=Phytoactinopolyspora limicola TaxID=2715536 RepID=UPI00140CBECE|nr:MaoC/PaaZ C-terminal domain-containing protein [Phytoactinopolyspora limicola]
MTTTAAPLTPIDHEPAWEPFVCDPWRARVLAEVAGPQDTPYLLDAAGRHGVVPPTFLVGQRVDAATLGVPDAPVRLNAGNWCRWEAGVEPGDDLERRTVVESATRKTGRSGELHFYELATTYRRRDTLETVARASTTTIRRHPATTSRSDPPARRPDQQGAPPPEAREVLSVLPSSRDVVRYAAATDDFYEVHYDDEFARSRGLPGTITHGLLKLAYLAAAAARWGGPGTFVREVSASYTAMDRVGQPFRVFVQAVPPAVDTAPGATRLKLYGVSANDQISTTGSALIDDGR